jgi:hypothetical protein
MSELPEVMEYRRIAASDMGTAMLEAACDTAIAALEAENARLRAEVERLKYEAEQRAVELERAEIEAAKYICENCIWFDSDNAGGWCNQKNRYLDAFERSATCAEWSEAARSKAFKAPDSETPHLDAELERLRNVCGKCGHSYESECEPGLFCNVEGDYPHRVDGPFAQCHYRPSRIALCDAAHQPDPEALSKSQVRRIADQREAE